METNLNRVSLRFYMGGDNLEDILAYPDIVREIFERRETSLERDPEWLKQRLAFFEKWLGKFREKRDGLPALYNFVRVLYNADGDTPEGEIRSVEVNTDTEEITDLGAPVVYLSNPNPDHERFKNFEKLLMAKIEVTEKCVRIAQEKISYIERVIYNKTRGADCSHMAAYA